MTDITKSILAINSNAQFSVDDEDINKITWLNNTTPIAIDIIKAKQNYKHNMITINIKETEQ